MKASLPKELEEAVSRDKRGVEILRAVWPPTEQATTVDAVQERLESEGGQVDRGEVIAMFRSLESRDVGRFVVGRGGHPSRMEWADGTAKAVGQASSMELAKDAGTIGHRFVLRPDFQVQLELPQDLNQREANRLAEFIRTLPFEPIGR